jgi:hypothetical protein
MLDLSDNDAFEYRVLLMDSSIFASVPHASDFKFHHAYCGKFIC